MTVRKAGVGGAGTLEAVRRLEQALEERTGAKELAAARLTEARGEADGILAAARAAGTEEGRRRVAVLMAEATAEAETIRAVGRADAEELRERVLADRDELVAEFAAIVTATEA